MHHGCRKKKNWKLGVGALFICSDGFQHDIFSLKRPHWLSFLLFLLSISVSQFMYGILQAWSGLNSLIWACLVPCVRRVRDDCFRRTSQADRQILPYADSLSILGAAACALTLCYQAGDWFLCPSCLPFPLCFKAQFREAYDVLTHAPWITLLKDASAQNISQKRKVLSFHLWRRVVAVQGTSSLWGGVWCLAEMRLMFGSQTSDCRGTN